MNKRDKRLERLRQNPKTVRFEEIDSVLRSLSFEVRQKGSHVTYARDDIRITIPINRPFIKPIYVKLVLQLFEGLDD